MKTENLYQFLQTIPQEKVVTYKYLAEKFGTHPRAIARILAANHEQGRYPCYKVIRNDGSLGGYNLGISEKIKRLKADGIEVKKGRIDLKKYEYFC